MKKLMIFAVVILYTFNANAQWTQCPLYGGPITSLIYDSMLYTGTTSKVFVSDNYGSFWNEASNGLPSGTLYGVSSIAKKGNEVYAGVVHAGLYKSTDNCATWSAVNTGLPQLNSSISSIIFVDSSIFISTINCPGTLYKSSDGGNTWIDVSPASDSLVSCLAYDNTGVYAGTYGGGVYKTTDYGTNWAQMNSGLTYNPPPLLLNVNAMIANDNVIYIGLNNYFIFKSTNHGASWTCCYGFYADVRCFAFVGNLVYGGTSTGICRTGDGQNWSSYNPGLYFTNVSSLAANGWDLFAGTNGGVFRLINGSNMWTNVSDGISTLTINSITNIGNSLFAGSQSAGIYLTDDNGITWNSRNNGITNLEIISSVADGYNTFAGSFQKVFKTSDFGNNWSEILSMTGPYSSVHSIVKTGTTIFICSYLGIYRSLDDGITWSPANTGLPSTDVSSLAINSSGYIFASVVDEGLYMSSNNGGNWTNISNSFGGLSYVDCVTTVDSFIIAGLSIFNPPVVVSNNYGLNWMVGSNPLYGHTITNLKTICNYVFAGLNDGLFFTKTYGDDWINMSDNLSGSEVMSIGRDDSCVYVGVNKNGIWKRPLSDFGILITGINEEITTTLTIFPNPANDILFIETEKNATIEIINIQGQIVGTKILTEKVNNLDLSNLVSGVYTLRIKTDRSIVMRKLIKQ